MLVKVGTFNLNNLFSRFNFAGAISQIENDTGTLTVRYEFSDSADFRIRTYRGKLVNAKDRDDTITIAERIRQMDVDVLAVQEAENIDILKVFNREHLQGLYKYQVLIDGNDPRLIDVGVLSKLPIGAIASFQTAVHPERPDMTVFGRDLLEVEIMNASRTRRLFTLYNNHLKSHFGDDDQGGQGRNDNDTRRRQQAETIQRIVGKRMRSDERYLIVGDMNDGPDAAPIAALQTIDGNPMTDALANPTETRAAKPESGGHDSPTPAWTHRFKKSGQPPEHRLFDQIWASPALSSHLGQAFIDRRTKHGGDGSDHDPAWVELDL